MEILLFLWVTVGMGMPVDVAEATIAASHRLGVEPAHSLAYVLSEHPGGRYSGSCSNAGACGAWQLSKTWTLYARRELPSEELSGDPRIDERGALLFVLAWLYSIDKHGDEDRAMRRLKGCEADTGCEYHLRTWKRYREQLRLSWYEN